RALTDHKSRRRFGAEKHPFEVHLHDPFPLLLFETQQEIIESEPGIVHQNIKLAMTVNDVLQRRGYVSAVRYVETAQLRLASTRMDAGQRFLSGILALEIIYRYQYACAGKPFSDCATDAA